MAARVRMEDGAWFTGGCCRSSGVHLDILFIDVSENPDEKRLVKKKKLYS